jgi:hypothetical protein
LELKPNPFLEVLAKEFFCALWKNFYRVFWWALLVCSHSLRILSFAAWHHHCYEVCVELWFWTKNEVEINADGGKWLTARISLGEEEHNARARLVCLKFEPRISKEVAADSG